MPQVYQFRSRYFKPSVFLVIIWHIATRSVTELSGSASSSGKNSRVHHLWEQADYFTFAEASESMPHSLKPRYH